MALVECVEGFKVFFFVGADIGVGLAATAYSPVSRH